MSLAFRAGKWLFNAALDTLPDPAGRRLRYWRLAGLRPPVILGDKIQRRRLLQRDPRTPPLVDKIDVKPIIAARLGPAWIIPTYFAGDSLPPVAQRDWPLPFILKPSHLSGEALPVRTPAECDWKAIEEQCRVWLATRWNEQFRDWAYTRIPPRIIVEEYIGGTSRPSDYKFFMFRERIGIIQVDVDRGPNHRRAFYDETWTRQPIFMTYPDAEPVDRPLHLDQMIAAARDIGADWPFIRVDFYDLPAGPKFGEITFCPGGGGERFEPPEWNRIFGEMWRE